MLINNLKSINEQIISCIESNNRKINEVKLIGVSKKKPIEMIMEAFDAGLKDFGEN